MSGSVAGRYLVRMGCDQERQQGVGELMCGGDRGSEGIQEGRE